MRVVLQRVSRASVSVGKEYPTNAGPEECGEIIGEIGRGFLVYLGVGSHDTIVIADKMADKICGLRIFQDQDGKTNLSLADVGGELLVVSQFTLYADCKKGNRPSFMSAGAPEHAEMLYNHVADRFRMYVPKVERGSFGADMKVELINDGPFTLVMDSSELGLE